MTATNNRLRPSPGAVAHLSAADPVLAGVIERVGSYDRPREPDLWRALASSIVSQQLSLKAAATIEGRLAALAGGDAGFPAPSRVLVLAEEELQRCGLSRAKVGYLRGIAAAFAGGELVAEEVATLDDDAVIERLTALRGVGRWTAQMVLIFCLGRPDVLPLDDLGFREAARLAYGLDERPGPDLLTRMAGPWRPHRSSATQFLWESRYLTPPAPRPATRPPPCG